MKQVLQSQTTDTTEKLGAQVVKLPTSLLDVTNTYTEISLRDALTQRIDRIRGHYDYIVFFHKNHNSSQDEDVSDLDKAVYKATVALEYLQGYECSLQMMRDEVNTIVGYIFPAVAKHTLLNDFMALVSEIDTDCVVTDYIRAEIEKRLSTGMRRERLPN